MSEIIKSPLFGVILSLAAYEIASLIQKKTKLSICNPLLLAMLLVILVLTSFNISYEDYNQGGQLISFFLYPATVALALPIYRKFHLLKANALPIVVSILSGNVLGIISIILLSKVFGLSEVLTVSLIPKSITTPIGMEVSNQLGGIPSVTVVAIILTGILGAVLGPFLAKLFKMKDRVSVGIAMGASSHALGTARAMELGEIEGAMSGLTMALSGIITVVLAPVIWKLFLILI
jgi:predicted murein hydrolase (TIGR00659 family)